MNMNATQELCLQIYNITPDMIKLFVKDGADINARFFEGHDAPLHMLAYNFFEQNAETLLQLGADANIVNDEQCTPLHIAAVTGSLKAISMFLKYGAQVNAQNCAGDTPLHIAINFRHKEAACLLIENNADIHIKNNDGYTVAQDDWYQTQIAPLLSNLALKVQQNQNNLAEEYLKLSSKEICERLIADNGLEEARRLFKGNLDQLAKCMDYKDAIRAYVYIFKDLYPEDTRLYKNAVQNKNAIQVDSVEQKQSVCFSKVATHKILGEKAKEL